MNLIVISRVPGKIYMPSTTPRQKISAVKRFGGDTIEIVLTGDTFDDSSKRAQARCDDTAYKNPRIRRLFKASLSGGFVYS
ncbi:hypothetical protein ACHOLT_20225 [Desulfitobacterium sp. Sab5]|uniref:hypothetical protein n=1 Tax=Desulfitobacterium nosdiversum TaxID=3375356 RepID=UPI003CFB0EE7